MPTGTPKQITAKAKAIAELDSKVSGRKKDFRPLKKAEVELQKGYVPPPIGFLADEMLMVGENFVGTTIEGQCIRLSNESDRVVLDFDSFIIVLRMLGYECVGQDRLEMAAWLRNHDCFAHGPSVT